MQVVSSLLLLAKVQDLLVVSVCGDLASKSGKLVAQILPPGHTDVGD
jgi:hypothetical protein